MFIFLLIMLVLVHLIVVLKKTLVTCQYRPSVDHEMSTELGEVPRPKALTGASMYSVMKLFEFYFPSQQLLM